MSIYSTLVKFFDTITDQTWNSPSEKVQEGDTAEEPTVNFVYKKQNLSEKLSNLKAENLFLSQLINDFSADNFKLANQNNQLIINTEILLQLVEILSKRTFTLENANKSLLKQIEKLENWNKLSFSDNLTERGNSAASDYFQKLDNEPANNVVIPE